MNELIFNAILFTVKNLILIAIWWLYLLKMLKYGRPTVLEVCLFVVTIGFADFIIVATAL